MKNRGNCKVRKRTKLLVSSFVLFISLFVLTNEDFEAKAKGKTYTISTTTKPINKSYVKYKNYNNSTKQYYTLRSYLERIEREGGGTLRLKKGTYTISNVLYIPSNTKLILSNGTTVRKGTTTGGASFKPSKTLFQLIESNIAKNKKATVSKYNGAKNIAIIGEGSAKIDLRKSAYTHGIVSAHSNNVKVSGIRFLNNHTSTFIHLIGTNNTTIENNRFENATESTKMPAVRLENAKKSKSVVSVSWNKYDQTPNNNIKIQNNRFLKQYTAVKTSDFNQKKLQSNISITKNNFSSMRYASLYVTGWNKPIISSNKFDDSIYKPSATIAVRGVQYPTIEKNTFIKSKRSIAFYNISTSLQQSVADYQNTLTLDNKREIVTNIGDRLSSYHITLPAGDYEGTGNKATIINLSNLSKKVYVFDENITSLNPRYDLRPSYTTLTRDYYVLRSILEQLEKQGGGKLVIKKGEYTITNTLFVPSNVTIELEDGVILKKAVVTDAVTMDLSSSLFQLVPPSKATKKGAVGGFDGTQNVKIYSPGRATLDLQNKFFSFAIIMAHTQNIEFSNIDFKNMNSGHFIELDASKNVLIDHCTFIDSFPTETLTKEAINLDTPDFATKGFSSIWSNFDRTANDGITIQNNTFENLDRAIGTHKYSGSGVINGVTYKNSPHLNVKIAHNEFKQIRNDAIRVMNWVEPIIENNQFDSIGGQGKRGILSSGAIHPIFRNNHFENTSRPIQFIAWKNSVNAAEYDVIVDALPTDSIDALISNTGKNMDEYFVRHTKVFEDYSNADKYNITEQ